MKYTIASNVESPVNILIPDIMASPFRIAPERQNELRSLIEQRNITVEIKSNEVTFLLESNSVDSKIYLSLPTLERLWAYSFSYLHIMTLFLATGPGQYLEFGKHYGPIVEDMKRLLLWALDEERLRKRDYAWPKHLPNPASKSYYPQIIEKTNEMYLGMMGWILLHEIAHINLNHVLHKFTDLPTRLNYEKAADKWATDWVFEKLPVCAQPDNVRVWRTIVVSLALSTIAAVEYHTIEEQSSDHPNPADRLLAFLTNYVGETGDAQMPLHEISWIIPMVVIQTHFANRNVPETLKGPYAGISDYLIEARKVF